MTNQHSPTDLRERINSVLPDLIEFRHDLHRHPELMYEEHRTSERIREELAKDAISFAGDLAGGTGVLAHVPGQAENAIGLRADMDALPIHEESGVEHASTIDGKMHACGHDGHTTILLGAAKVLKAISTEHDLPNPVSFVFQPAEEGGAGGQRMVEDGCLNGSVIGPAIERMYGLHGWPAMTENVVGSRPGPLLAAADRFKIEIRGQGGHAAMPHTTADPITAAATIITTLQQSVSRHIDPVLGGVVSVTVVQSGSAFNVIPDNCILQGTVRALYPEVRDTLKSAVHDIPKSVAAALGCQAIVDYHDGYPVTRNDPSTTSAFHELAREVLGDDQVEPLEFPVMGGEDFAYYCEQVPSCFFVLGQCPKGQDTMPGLHHPAFDFNDQTIATGVEMFCRLAMQ
ncbi:MAG: hypothetical protein CMJ29_04825 [Phycisphaerae bacterium]|nr:hypothetical protein [Phycisphaerae bacterium]